MSFATIGSSGSHTRDRSSYRILTAIWLLSMVVLINGYSGVLTSYLTIPKLNPIVNTIKEVAERKELRVTVEKNVPISKLFMVYLKFIIQFFVNFQVKL